MKICSRLKLFCFKCKIVHRRKKYMIICLNNKHKQKQK
uniref:Ribosomal protein n=1 Tax=Nephromyces sp. ex Molgula occidentalis TaxID=2544991 RepID=A0A5C1H850_9APIC|nr:50S ribosomal protein L36 [Nephromyces sp. ex Molgula occidentalis]